MTSYALQIVADGHGHFRWVLLDVDSERVLTDEVSDADFESYAAALNAGTSVLAAADDQPYFIEALDSNGEADCTRDN